MPELPEVETISRALDHALRRKKITAFWTNWPKKVLPSPAVFRRAVVGAQIERVGRSAKIIIITLRGGQAILIHLKLTGQLIYKLNLPAGKAGTKNSKLVFGGHPQRGGLDYLPNTYTHYRFDFSDGSTLFFNDLRKFGWVHLQQSNEVDQLIDAAGIEPLSSAFTLKKLTEIIKRFPNRPIKQVIMDQTLISGVGNIYADESLFAARILPMRPAKSLSATEIKTLHRALPALLRRAVKHKGTSTDNVYVGIDAAPGGFAKYLKVYGRRKERCRRCQGPILKIKLGGRGTHYCPQCQQ